MYACYVFFAFPVFVRTPLGETLHFKLESQHGTQNVQNGTRIPICSCRGRKQHAHVCAPVGADRHGNSNFKRQNCANHSTQTHTGQMKHRMRPTPAPQSKKQLTQDTTQWQQPRAGKVGGTWGDQPNTTKPKTTDTRHNTMETTKGWANKACLDSRGGM